MTISFLAILENECQRKKDYKRGYRFRCDTWLLDRCYGRKIFVEMKSDFLTDFWKGFIVALGVSGGIFIFIELMR